MAASMFLVYLPIEDNVNLMSNNPCDSEEPGIEHQTLKKAEFYVTFEFCNFFASGWITLNLLCFAQSSGNTCGSALLMSVREGSARLMK